jgi:hypothetical protein
VLALFLKIGYIENMRRGEWFPLPFEKEIILWLMNLK